MRPFAIYGSVPGRPSSKNDAAIKRDGIARREFKTTKHRPWHGDRYLLADR